MAAVERGPLEKFGYLFYAVSPNRTAFEKIEDVPNYVVEVVPFFLMLIILETVIASILKRSKMRINDGIGSIAQGMLQELTKVLFRGIELTGYIYIYTHWRIVSLPWNSPWTWFLCFLLVDLGYYIFHRASHEINILWAAHQVHHSSEDYNLSTALRQSVLQNYGSWIFYLPLALFMPPGVFLVHNQFNTLYQFWIHTELISSLGPLEYILNTPSHHRVHHGRNRYCIDKNYAGTLIIWDRIFGTFEPESKRVVYGLTHPINTFSHISIQLCHYKHILNTVWETEGLSNKLSVILKGPGWAPGKPRQGLIEDIPDVHYPMEKYDPQVPFWCNAYIILHFVFVMLGHIEITERYGTMSQSIVLAAIAYQIFSLTTIGALLDGRNFAPLLELCRCLLFLLVDYYYLPVTRISQFPSTGGWILANFIRTSFLISTGLWTFYSIRMTSIHFYRKKIE